MRSLGKKTLLITGMLVCPCHMPLLLPLLATLLSGTVLGAWLSANMGLVFLATTLYFVVVLVVGIRWIVRAPIAGTRPADVTTCLPATLERQSASVPTAQEPIRATSASEPA